MTDATPWATIRVRSAAPNPESEGHWDRWQVDCEVLPERGAGWPTNLDSLRLLIHSPTKTFAIPYDELSGERFRIALEPPIDAVYRGPVRVLGEETP